MMSISVIFLLVVRASFLRWTFYTLGATPIPDVRAAVLQQYIYVGEEEGGVIGVSISKVRSIQNLPVDDAVIRCACCVSGLPGRWARIPSQLRARAICGIGQVGVFYVVDTIR